MTKTSFVLPLLFALVACSSPSEGPDKTVGGAVLGAAWGAGSGAVIGNQLTHQRAGEGAGIGAAFGMVSGAAIGLSHDEFEDTQIKHQKELDALAVQNAANRQELATIQGKLDYAKGQGLVGNIYQVFFDTDATSLRSGATANLELIADSIKRNPAARHINVDGHSDDGGDLKYNKKLSEARARSVAAYLSSRGISADQIRIKAYGSTRPLASNATAEGRAMNRRVDVYVTK